MSLRDRLIRFFKNNPSQVFAKETMVKIVQSKMNRSSEYINRTLRKLAEENLLKVTYNGKSGHAHYQWAGNKTLEEMVEHDLKLFGFK